MNVDTCTNSEQTPLQFPPQVLKFWSVLSLQVCVSVCACVTGGQLKSESNNGSFDRKSNTESSLDRVAYIEATGRALLKAYAI